MITEALCPVACASRCLHSHNAPCLLGKERPVLGQSSKSEFDYDVIYFWTSHYVHATIIALDGHASERGAVFRVGSRRWIEKERGVEALFNVLVFISKIFICGCRAMREDQPEKILGDINTLVSRFADRRRKGTVP